MSEWISVKDKLPDENQQVVVFRKNSRTGNILYQLIFWWRGDESEFTYWMPIPAQPPESD